MIEMVPLFRVEELAGYIHPDAAVFLREVVRQKTVWHQMEPVKIHALPPHPSPESVESLAYE
jgi:hypothetical protein